ncbi:hypothetical protein C8Q80DRAFT_1104630, partial [Daedaleopsis nitida]
INGEMITEDYLFLCAALFSNNYGVWGQKATPLFSLVRNRVKMTPAKLRQQCLTHPYNTILSVAWENGEFVGHAFATKWKYGDGYVGWITQLVIDKGSRQQRVASMLLNLITKASWFNDVKFMGLVSSHPAACHALCNVFNVSPDSIDLGIIAEHAAPALACTNVDYLKHTQLRGSLFQRNPQPGVVSSVYTVFWVDHAEPLAALGMYKQHQWPLGELLDGHEYLLLIPAVKHELPADPFIA